ncbi:2240_t:CDS:2 [Gigaspora margarita]|uniref:2240_t:CDS:1 n=1 Tax=Gigaspora margarita TaxID=4874 RepID=A0ABN7V255_GIGMA|nr:2240_t:CDS:2 [Gigaspora margarita]
MDEFDEITINSDALYGFASTSASTSYNNILGDNFVNNILYGYQNEINVSDILYNTNQTRYENDDMMNYEDTQHENIIENDRFQLINKDPQSEELRMNIVFRSWDHTINEIESMGRDKDLRCIATSTKSKDQKKETTSKCIGCTWQINLSCLEKNNSNKIIYITKLVKEHKNHDLDHKYFEFWENLEVTLDMVKDVEFYLTKMNCSPQQIRKALEEKYSVKIYMPVLHWVIKRFHSKPNDQANDASYLYEELLKKKKLILDGDVILNDNTAATNHYEMALSLFLEVDNHLSSRLVAQALTDDETKEAHTWILQQIKKATFEATPHVIFTDADPALIAAIQDEFPTTHALNCMFHIKCLLEKYNNENVISYLQRVLYTNKESWAKAFVLKLFIAGMFSTSRVESYNAKIKRLIFNSNTTLLELAEKLLVCILKKNKKTEYALFHASIPKTALTTTAEMILPNVYPRGSNQTGASVPCCKNRKKCAAKIHHGK